MRISKLYIKIFATVLLGLVLAEVLIFGVVRRIYREEFRSEVGRVADSQALLVRNFVDARLQNGRDVQAICDELGRFVPGRVWALDEAYGVLAASAIVEGGMPVGSELAGLSADELRETIAEVLEEPASPEGLRVEFDGRVMYALLPLRLAAQGPEYLYVAMERKRRGPAESSFLLALIGIAVAFGLLLWPLSRMLGRPLGELRASALRIADGDLEHRVQARGHSSDEIGELGRAFNVMADRVQRMVTGTRELTAHVSHELRSPLARIRVATELLKDMHTSDATSAADSSALNLHAEIDTEIADLDRLIGRILQLSRLDLQAPRPSAPRPLAELLRELAALAERYRPIFERGGLRLELDLDLATHQSGNANPDLPDGGAGLSAVCSVPDLQAVFSVLFDNAAKYAHSYMSVALIPAQLPELLRIVCRNDRPPGAAPLSAVERENLFEAFQRGADQAQGRDPVEEESGWGLGLAIARKTARRAGGELSLQESPDSAGSENGTLEFVLELPLQA